MRITDEQVEKLHRDGYVLVDDFVSGADLEKAREATLRYFPDSAERLRTPERYATLKRSAGFPYEPPALNHLSLHPELISGVERVLGTRDVRLGDSIMQAKYGSRIAPAHTQQLHNEAWGRNTLVPPRGDGVYQRVLAIVYLSDVTEELGPTCVVPRKHTADVPLLSSGYSAYSRAEFPWLYELEEPVPARAGSVLLLTGTTVHRCSAVRDESGHRFALYLNFHAADSIWLDKQTWVGSPASADGPALCRFMAQASPRQRELLGFPAPGSPYWNRETVAGLAELYPGMDVTPYSRA
ncbi:MULTISPECIES: phytanoyl-CoA dioxygenase family protein [unclassified Streptomyces]|uniref:phytanoyl-CoA dioxygenase family protein n=1 Tax=unclassified Streptomyces TaxID=2593676 RepID=UPI0023673F09|nr:MULTISPECIES: phytanoyl-CoA dioxygenase family protein [unclassified Streptomyces]MDF3145380.1 phytanoyl-CoA dioxygenase family protein [Streptomyces sp. T21Q-yed]WDF39819.1 phytanoyl-CoA dioxygenase family protein [Streptomyces sp. T12]